MNQAPFKDHFSGHADNYARYRPDYPPALFTWLAKQTSATTTAWDCATGNGQAAAALAQHFDRVFASDASHRQIDNAVRQAGIEYCICPAEKSGLRANSVDLVTVAQALHWFDLPVFYDEVERVLKPDGVIAVWSYALFQVTPEIDRLVHRLYSGIVGAYWPPERRHVEAGYEELAFPFSPLAAPQFEMEQQWRVEQALGYLDTWSAVQKFLRDRGESPLLQIRDELRGCWGNVPRRVTWPLRVKAGVV